MKPLDEHLRDASNAWLQDARPTMISTAEELATSLKPVRYGRYVAGGLGLVATVATTWWLFTTFFAVQAPLSHSLSVPTLPPSAVALSDAPIPVPPASASAPARSNAGTSVADPVVTPESVSTERANGGRLTADPMVDGFSAEYERVLSRAMHLEATDPLRAATEYLGLGRLCIVSRQYAHAVSALQRAEEIARRGNFTHLLPQVQQQLNIAQEKLAK